MDKVPHVVDPRGRNRELEVDAIGPREHVQIFRILHHLLEIFLRVEPVKEDAFVERDAVALTLQSSVSTK